MEKKSWDDRLLDYSIAHPKNYFARAAVFIIGISFIFCVLMPLYASWRWKEKRK